MQITLQYKLTRFGRTSSIRTPFEIQEEGESGTRCPAPHDALLSVGEPVGPGGSACLGTAVRRSSPTEPDRSGRRRPLFLSTFQEVAAWLMQHRSFASMLRLW